MNELLTRIDNSHKALQTLNITATKENLAILFDALTTLEECFRFVNETKMAAEHEEGTKQKEGLENA